MGDLYLHGGRGQPGYIAVRGFDLRTLLFQDIVLNDCEAQRLWTPKPIPIALEFGAAPCEEFSDETRSKSGLNDDESIVYARVVPGRLGPTAWRPAGVHSSGMRRPTRSP